MKAYAVRIDPNNRSRPKTERGHVWVKSATHQYYVTIGERGIFETKEEAEHARTELWEIIVDVVGKTPTRVSNPAQRQADRDARLRKQGKVQRRVWARPEHWPAILEFVANLDEKS